MMAPLWQPGVQYNYGDVVVFEGAQYQIVQPHRSQGDWTPPLTPALWGRMQGGGCDDNYREKCGGDCQPNQGYGQQQSQAQYQGGNQEDQPAGSQHEHKTWIQEHETDLKVGGGILAGAAALGAGFLAIKRHGEKKEQQRAQAWSAQIWYDESQARTQQWRAGHYNGPVAWVWNEGKNIPRDAIQGGEERGEPLYICRAYHEGGIMVGKASEVFKKGAVIGYRKEEIHLDRYEILVGNSRAVKWVPTSGNLNLGSLRAQPVEGGREPDGAPIYVAQAPHHNAVHPGKACEVYGDGCYIPYDKTEKKVKEYAILCYA